MIRSPKYLRVSLLSSCNLKCVYCRPPGEDRSTILAPKDKVQSAIRFLLRLGIRKVRFTGGEPTLSKNLCEHIAFIKTIDSDVRTAITSNGVLIKSRAYALAKAGLDSANISIDTLGPEKFNIMTGRSHLKHVISGIDAATKYIDSVKLNSVLIRGVNDDEAQQLILFANDRGLDIRFIEFMPNRYSAPGDRRFISSEEVRERLPWDFKSISGKSSSAAEYYTSPSLGIKVGFISSVSHPFCKDCDRIRLTADGLLYACLYDSRKINLFDLLAVDPGQAQVEFKKLIESKRFRGCRTNANSASTLPSFSAIGG